MSTAVRFLSLIVLLAVASATEGVLLARDGVLEIDVAANSSATATCSVSNAQSGSQVFVCGVLVECPCLGPAPAVMSANNLLEASAYNNSTLFVTVSQGNDTSQQQIAWYPYTSCSVSLAAGTFSLEAPMMIVGKQISVVYVHHRLPPFLSSCS